MSCRQDPIERERYCRLGRLEEWITARLGVVATRNEMTDEWKRRGGCIFVWCRRHSLNGGAYPNDSKKRGYHMIPPEASWRANE